jgi:3-deoxy-D-manno-octulosonic-acid transferase
VAGSTWPRDEAILLQAFSGVLAEQLNARLILVPHEPTSQHLTRLERSIRNLGLPRPVRVTQASTPAPIMLVDRVGILAALYGAGIAAYVGGGFGTAGLHSVLEPAAWQLPVAFGPRWKNSRDAELLLEAQAAVALPAGRRAAVRVLQRQWCDWISNEESTMKQGRRARAVVDSGRGASERGAALLLRLISGRRPRT